MQTPNGQVLEFGRRCREQICDDCHSVILLRFPKQPVPANFMEHESHLLHGTQQGIAQIYRVKSGIPSLLEQLRLFS